MAKKYIIIGVSAAGIAAAQKLRQLDPDGSIICISDEAEWPYNKCVIADYVAGTKNSEQVQTISRQAIEQKNIELLLGTKVLSINASEKTILLDNGKQVSYDKLLVALGTQPRQPHFTHIKAIQGVFNFHRLRDAQGLLHFIAEHKVKKVVVVGAGLSGLECADALHQRGLDVTVIEQSDRTLGAFVDERASHFIAQHMASGNVNLMVNQTIGAVHESNGCVVGITVQNNLFIQADMVIFAIGLQPNLSVAQSAGIKLHEQGILVNEYMQTTDPSIYAAGDCIVVCHSITKELTPNRTWPEAMLQGIIAAHAMADQPKAYPHHVPVVSSAFFDVKFAQAGYTNAFDHDQKIIIHADDHYYHKFIVENNILKGFLLIGKTDKLGILRRSLLTGQPIDSERVLIDDLNNTNIK